MKMEVLPVQNQYQYPAHFALTTDWKSQLTLPNHTTGGSLKPQPSYKFSAPLNNNQAHGPLGTATATASASDSHSSKQSNCDTVKNAAAVQELSASLLDELRQAKSRHLACTEVSLPCDLTRRIATEILRIAAQEAHGLRGCTIYIEFEDEPGNSRRIATLRPHPHPHPQQQRPVAAYEIYLTLRPDNRGWSSLLPQFMKSLSRTITISPAFSVAKHKPYHSRNLC